MSEITLEALKNERKSLMKKLELIDRAIMEYSANDGNDFEYIFNKRKSRDGFPVKAKWLDQILHLLDNRNRFMSNQELAEALTDYHYGFNVDKMKRKVSVVISAAYKTNRIDGLVKVGTTRSAKDALWGFDKWLTKDKKIKEKHKPFGIAYSQRVLF